MHYLDTFNARRFVRWYLCVFDFADTASCFVSCRLNAFCILSLPCVLSTTVILNQSQIRIFILVQNLMGKSTQSQAQCCRHQKVFFSTTNRHVSLRSEGMKRRDKRNSIVLNLCLDIYENRRIFMDILCWSVYHRNHRESSCGIYRKGITLDF